MLFNPGSVGDPAYRDDNAPAHVSEQGSPLARYGIVEVDGSGTLTSVEFRAVAYDHEAAARHADRLIVTDDNPRSEDPAAIRKAVLRGAPKAEEIGDRRRAIRTAVADLRKGDILLIAGKGHETGQTIGEEVHPFSDQEEARAALAAALAASKGAA